MKLNLQENFGDNRYVRAGFMQKCRQLFIAFAKEMSERLEIPLRRFKILKCFHPENALNPIYLQNNPNLFITLSEQFVRAVENAGEFDFTVHTLQHEYSLLPNFIPQPVGDDWTFNEFWNTVKNFRNDNGEFIFKNIAKFAFNIFSVGHANAEPERQWSQKNLIRTALRNRLKLALINALMHLKDYVKKNAGYLVPSEEMITALLQMGNVNRQNVRMNRENVDLEFDSDDSDETSSEESSDEESE